MTRPKRIALSLPVPPDVDTTLAYAKWAEHEGFDDIWFTDAGNMDALTLAAAVAERTERIRIGLAVIPVYTRTPAVLAATAATLSHLAPGRIVLGLGASSHAMIEGWHGQAFEKPLTRVRETATLVRSMLAGERSDFSGETLRSHGYTQQMAPKQPVPLFLAALRPRMLELAGEIGDGVATNLFPVEALPKMLEHIATGARRAGADLADREVICRHQVTVTANKPAAREVVRQRFGPYYATPVYNKFLAWCGEAEAAAAIAEGFAEKDRGKTAAALSDDLIDRIAIIGTAEECRQRVREMARGGIDTHIIASTDSDFFTVRATFETFSPRTFSFE